LPKDLAIKEQQCALGLVLRRNRDAQVDGEMRQKLLDVICRQLAGGPLTVKAGETANPIDIGLLGPQTVAPEANSLAQAVDQPVQFALHGEYPV
jgi:hypothetical protein